jgi:hypothetical protein
VIAPLIDRSTPAIESSVRSPCFDLLGAGTMAGRVCKELRLFMCDMGEILRSSKMSDGKSVCSVKVWDRWWGGGDDSA